MEECEEKDTYVTQLKEVFDSCDTSGNGCLNEEEFRFLCEKLHLEDHTETLIHHLFQNEIEVKFEEFKECFVAMLTQAIPNNEEVPATTGSEDITDREVSPKLTWGRKKYGRRSRPVSVAGEEGSFSPLVLSPQNSVDPKNYSDDAFEAKSVECVANKRPMSPSPTQSRPMKSGRIVDEPMILSEEMSQVTSESDTAASQAFDNNLVQYLQETWKKLNIGDSGYLNVEELGTVCEHIGMDMTEEVVSQLFEKLDCDQDGQISFDEFLQGLFQHGDPQGCDSPLPAKSLFKEGSRDDEISNASISGIFSSIDVHNSGFADASSILEHWESLLEVPCSPQLLEEVGFNPQVKLNLSDLSTVLEEVLCGALNRPILQLAFASFQNEMQFLRQTVEQVQRERNKLRVNVEEANSRAALLAQEVDDNHAKLENNLHKKLVLMEKKYQEQARELVDELEQERDSLNCHANKVKQQLLKDVDLVREEEAKLRSQLGLLEQENSRLEIEVHETSEKYLESQKLNEVFQKELSVIPDLKKRLADYESQLNDMQEQSHQNLLQDLENYKKVNQELQDKIDELTLEMENIQQSHCPDTSSPKSINRTHSWLSDYRKTVKRRSSDSSSEEHSDEDSHSSGKIRKTFLLNGKPMQTQELLNSSGMKKRGSKGCIGLLNNMMLDQSVLLRKLQVSEESRLKMEKAFRQSENKNKMLIGLVRNMSGAITA